MPALVEDYAFLFEHPALKLWLLNNDPARRDSSARIDDAVPRNISIILRRGMHGPADQPGAVSVFEQAGYLAVRHHATARNAQYQAVDFFKRLLILFGAARRLVFGGLIFSGPPFSAFPGSPLKAHSCHRYTLALRAIEIRRFNSGQAVVGVQLPPVMNLVLGHGPQQNDAAHLSTERFDLFVQLVERQL